MIRIVSILQEAIGYLIIKGYDLDSPAIKTLSKEIKLLIKEKKWSSNVIDVKLNGLAE